MDGSPSQRPSPPEQETRPPGASPPLSLFPETTFHCAQHLHMKATCPSRPSYTPPSSALKPSWLPHQTGPIVLNKSPSIGYLSNPLLPTSQAAPSNLGGEQDRVHSGLAPSWLISCPSSWRRPGSHAASAAYWSCGLGQLADPPWTSVLSFVKWS